MVTRDMLITIQIDYLGFVLDSYLNNYIHVSDMLNDVADTLDEIVRLTR